jgi:hypothetical protein
MTDAAVNAQAIQQAVAQMRALIAQEGDAREFEHAGYHCLIFRNPAAGYLSGFVGIPSTHPYYDVDHDTVEDIEVHGGLQYSGPQVEHGKERPDHWYLGFDCNQFDDLCLRDLLQLDAISFGLKRSASYKSMPYVESEVRRLAEQLKAAEHKRVYR